MSEAAARPVSDKLAGTMATREGNDGWPPGKGRASKKRASHNAGRPAAHVAINGSPFLFINSLTAACAGDTPWHSDSPWPEDWRTPSWYELLVYLDPLTAETGALRVLPGSHLVQDAFASPFHRGIMDETESALVEQLLAHYSFFINSLTAASIC